MVASKDMSTLPENFLKVFWNNQFKVKIDVPNRSKCPSLDGKVAVITGSNTGLGFESARQLLSLGLSHLVVAVRSIEKGKTAASKLCSANPSAKIDVWPLDMESYESIESFVRRCDTELPQIDFVILNAGLSPVKFETSLTGHEMGIQVNYISTTLLMILLLPILKARSKNGSVPRITVINSIMAHLAKFPNRNERPLLPSFDNTTYFGVPERYGVSKLLAQLFLVELTDMVKPDDVTINMVDPGLTKSTGLGHHDPKALNLAAKMAGRLFLGTAARPVEVGAATFVDALIGHGKESHGCFLMNTEIAPLATFYYTDDGKKATEQIWKETMEELSFAHVEEIVASMK